MMQKIELENAFVLHTRAFRNTSLIVDCFTKNHGRVTVVARGVRKPKSPWRSLLQPFVPIKISWIGRSEMGTLTQAESARVGFSVADSHSTDANDRGEGSTMSGIVSRTTAAIGASTRSSTRTSTGGRISGRALVAGFYLNELLMKLLHPHDPHAPLYDLYNETLEFLIDSGSSEPLLRRFEKRLLQELGYGLVLDREPRSGEAVQADCQYLYDPQLGPCLVEDPDQNALVVSGRTLLAMAQEQFEDSEVLRETKQIMRRALSELLGHKNIRSRELWV